MPHPGFGFTRRSYHTLKQLSCPRAAYINQFLGVRRKPDPNGEDGYFAAGSLWHTLMEVFYTPPQHKGKPLPGTDGNPAGLMTPEDVLQWGLEGKYAPSVVAQVKQGWQRYVYHYKDDMDLRSRVVGRPEPDVRGDFRHPQSPYAVPYDTGLDLVVRSRGRKSVWFVEHKFLGQFGAQTLTSYRNSGQVIGQVANWNSRPDLVERFGPAEGVMMNITLKRASPPHTQREDLFVPVSAQNAYRAAVRAMTTTLNGLLHADREAERPAKAARAAGREPSASARAKVAQAKSRCWSKLGMATGECAPLVGAACPYLHVCSDGDKVAPELYQITEAGRQRAIDDGIIEVPPAVEVYDDFVEIEEVA